MSELKAYTEEELAEHQQLYDEVFTTVWESEGQYCRAGGGQYEKSFAWWAFKHQQSKVDELQKRVDAALIKLDKRWNESWSNWKEKADMYEQGAANAFEEAYWLLEQALKGGDQNTEKQPNKHAENIATKGVNGGDQ